MHFKRLQVQGYKSFATRTVFDIDPGITAVVGPNGSGKSNIMDALRWVLGETSTRQMRAKRLEEVIFAGSEKRAPAGFAEVRIVLDNSDGWLPVDFAEVEVTRRVHRSGDSEFLINDNRVRLREIQDLFARSGLGSGSYALMGQGLVEEVLRLKPEERRGLIEEVADVRRHRIKMDEARHKRSQAHENLERARLLIEEIEPRMRTLERQAKRALQHAELSAELRAALRRYYRREWGRLRSELAERRASGEERQGTRDLAARALRDAETALDAWSKALREARETLERVSAERRRLSERVRELEHEQEIGEQRRGLLAQRLEELEADLASLAGDESEARQAPSGAEAERAESLQSAAGSAGEVLERAAAALRETDAEQDVLRRRVVESEQSVQRLDDRTAERKARLARVGAERVELEQAGATRAERIVTLRQRLEEAESGAAEATEAVAEASRQATEARQSREALAQRAYGAGAFLRSLEASRGDRERRLARARDRLQMLRELQAESEGLNQGLRALFGSRGVPHGDEPSGIPGVVGVMRHLVRAPRGLEKAIEAALGEYLDAVIFESRSDVVGTLEVLVRERAGRIVALPLADIRHRSAIAMQAERGVVGVASALVRCDDRYRELIDTLLGRIIVVESLEDAERVLKRQLGAAVTREGHLLQSNGAMSGGQIAEAGAFTRENELQALPGQIETLERSLAESADVEEPRADVERLERELREAESAGEAAAAAREQAQGEAAGRQADLARLGVEIEALEAESQRVGERLRALSEEEGTLAAEESGAEAARGAAQAERPDEGALTALAERREEQTRSVGEAAAQRSAVEGEARALQEVLQAREAALTRVREQSQARRSQIADVEVELSGLRQTIETRASGLSAAREARDAGSTAGDSEESSSEAERVARLVSLEGERRESVQTAQHRQIEAERELVTAEAAVQESEAAVAHLGEQIRADDLAVDAGGRIVSASQSPVPRFLSQDAAQAAASATTVDIATEDIVTEDAATEGATTLAGAMPSSVMPSSATGAAGEPGEGESGGAKAAGAGAQLSTALPSTGVSPSAPSGDAVIADNGANGAGLVGDGVDDGVDNGAGHGSGTSGGGGGGAEHAVAAGAVSDEWDDEQTVEADAGDDEQPLAELREEIETLRGRLRWLGNVNPDAAAEFSEVRERYEFLSGEIDDLEGGEQRMLAAEAELSGLIRERFEDAFNAVDREFRRYFQLMFSGGSARLTLTEEGDWEASGVSIVAQPPGKRVDNLTMLSGGERSLTAIALLFAMLEVNPAPFCVLDEVDAALDEANVNRFVNALRTLAERTQFVVITHNRRTIEQADSIYGITMGDDSVSRVLSVRLADLDLDEE